MAEADENYGEADARTNSVSLAIVIYVLRERESFSSVKGKLLFLRIQTPWENTGWTTDGRNFDLWAPSAVCGPILKSFGLLIAHMIRFF